MNNDIGRMRCPVCGTPTGARVNKNGIIYLYCPNSHHVRLSREDSRAASAAIRAGTKWHNELIYIYPHERIKDNGSNGTVTSDTARAENTVNGRTDGQPAAVGSNAATNDDEFSFGLI